jgi:putative cardiolipin synthase
VAENIADDIAQAMNEDNSWRLKLTDGKVFWSSGNEVWEDEPETELSERIKSRLLQLLPIEKYL